MLLYQHQLDHKETEFNLELLKIVGMTMLIVGYLVKEETSGGKWRVTSEMGDFKTDSGNLLVSFFLGGSFVLKVQVDHSLRNPLQE